MNTPAIFILRSVTAAMKAKKLLTENGFAVKIVKQASRTGEGCHYGISVTAGNTDAALALLRRNGVTPLNTAASR